MAFQETTPAVVQTLQDYEQEESGRFDSGVLILNSWQI